MNKKRILAVVLAFLMAATILPLAAFAADGDTKAEPVETKEAVTVDEKSVGIDTYESYINYGGTHLSYTVTNFTSKTGTWDSGATYKYVESTNHTNSSTAKVTSGTFFMKSGETLQFQYKVSSEENYDKFSFLANGSQVFEASGEQGWSYYTYTCSSSGDYYFEWRYTKDGSTSSGDDCVKLGFVTYSRHQAEYLTRAVLNQGHCGSVYSTVSTGTYPFYVSTSTSANHPEFVMSGNAGQANSDSVLTAKVYVDFASSSTPVTLYFDYAVSSEANYDKLIFKDGSTTVANFSGTDDYNWKTYSYNITSSGIHTFTWTYHKDSSNNSGEDVACVDNIRVKDYDADMRTLSLQQLNASDTSATLTFTTPEGADGFAPCSSSDGSDYWAAANNRFMHSSSAMMETYVNMAPGETLRFQYKVSSESTYDKLRLFVNGSEEMSASGSENNPSWHYYTFTATETRTYLFRWVYSKDSSNSYGDDSCFIDTVKYTGTRHNTFDLDTALIDTGYHNGDANVYSDWLNGYEYFMPYSSPSSGNCLVSRNQFCESSTAGLYAYIFHLVPGDEIGFLYRVSSEAADKLHIHLECSGGGVPEVNTTVSGTENDSWHTFYYECTYAGDYSLGIEFVKDSSVNSYEDAAYISDFYVHKADAVALDEAMNAPGSMLHFYNSGDYDFVAGYQGSELFGEASNTGNLEGGDTCTAVVSTRTYLDAGDTFGFDYWFDIHHTYSDWNALFTCEVECDETYTLLNYTNTQNSGWAHKSFTAFTSGYYTFTWLYSRPQRGYEFAPNDFVRIKNVEISYGSGMEWPGIDEALNVTGGNLQFDSDTWFGDFWYDDDIASSSNFGSNNTTATLSTSVSMNAGDKLRFQYFVSSEEDYDIYYFYVNGNIVQEESGLVEWDWFVWTAPAAGNYTFTWAYHKDSSRSEGMDCVKLDHVEVISSGTPGGLLGDVNGDNVVDVSDALLVLRYAMGIISTLPHPENGDINGGGIDLSDALLILRAAMGIITL